MWDKVLESNPISDAIALDLDYRNDRYRALDSGVLVEKPWADIVNNYSAPAGRTYFDSAGVLQTAAANTPIRAYDPATGEFLGNQIWGSYSNLHEDSQTYSRNITFEQGVISTVLPTGGINGTPCLELKTDTTSSNHRKASGNISVVAGSYVFSFALKEGLSRYAQFLVSNTGNWGGLPGCTAKIDCRTGAVLLGTSLSLVVPVIDLGDGWFEYHLRATSAGSTVSGVSFGPTPSPSFVNNVESYTGTGNESLLVTNVSMHAGDSWQPHVVTDTTPVTVAAENQIIDGSVFSDIWNESGVSIFAKVRSNYNSDASMILSAGTAFDNWVALRRLRGSSPLNYPDAVVTPVGGGSPAAFSASTAVAASLENIAFSIKDSEFAYFARNGSVSTTPPFIPGMPTVTQMELGFRAFGTPYHLNGYIERLVIFNRALPPSLLQRPTA
tara:strand:+ start:8416 stop:9738 length:1323 start_codon:yes stop_codon:yes gene_type:complete